jgi:outer membrane receptor protein involved in Fe transport
MVSTLENGGDATINGWEFNFVKPLNFLPGIGRNFTVKSNGTFIHLSGQNTPDFRGFISKSGNVSLSYNKAPVVLNLNVNFRGRQKGTSITAPAEQTGAQYGTGNGFFEYYEPRVNLDISGEYKLNRRYNLFFAVRNILNQEQVIERYSAASPSYASEYRHEEFGVNFSLGVKGRF